MIDAVALVVLIGCVLTFAALVVVALLGRLRAETFTPSGDWCSVCFRDLDSGEVWEVREHFTNEAEMGAEGGSWMASTYCRECAPEDAIRA